MSAAPTTHGGPAARAARRHPVTLLRGVIAVAVLCVALATAGGTYAFWASEAQIDAGSVSSGSAALEARWTAAEEAQPLQDLLPGEAATRSLRVANTGDVPLALAAASPVPARGLSFRLTEGSCGQSAPATAPLHSGAQQIPAADRTGSAAVVPPGREVELCLHVTATTDLAPGTETTFSLRIDGTQTA